MAVPFALWALHCALPSNDEFASGSNAAAPEDGDAGNGTGPGAGPKSELKGATDASTAVDAKAEAGVAMSSCIGLASCAGESCCTSPQVVGGTYARTYTNDGTGAKGLADMATVSSFRLDKYEVTVGRFRKFVSVVNAGWRPAVGSGKHALNGGKGLAAAGSAGGFETGWLAVDDGNVVPTSDNLTCDPAYATWTAAAGASEQKPVNCVAWAEAYAFCIWDGGFLPSEAEWEYAAAGGSEQRLYPWGTLDPGTGNQYAIYDCLFPVGSGTCSDRSNIAPAGTTSLGAGRWGHLDQLGNMWEWNLDFYAPYTTPCSDCAGVTPTASHVFRGGSFDPVTADELPTYRTAASTARAADRGFRCARPD